MKERPILFSGEMVRAILDGRKTQTRRVLKSPDATCYDPRPYRKDYEVGMRLWVRETWGQDFNLDPKYSLTCQEGRWRGPLSPCGTFHPYYRADLAESQSGFWKPSIFMPRWASRISLEVVSVHVERLQDISEGDAVAEGIVAEDLPPDSDNFHPPGSYGYVSGLHPFPKGTIYVKASQAYRELWDSINSDRGFGWDKNPWVWVIEFKKVEREREREAANGD